ncbi:copper homeostasis protein CutC [Hamadaea tsunoensis]|uniref:copper homeostasis protein CutC n=1 Tax=Hamadaea tsunoensis TaxID=53368 RepID=UPI000482064F|nr:copper homeostasis protein CutC [Hamadaea tsunoensis]
MLLEVIALSPADAEAAQAGGADRVELCAGMSADGLSPSAAVAAAVVVATDLPVRVMLRSEPSFRWTPDLPGLADDLLATGVDGLVAGFLDDAGEVDLVAAERLAGVRWTFHRAVDHAADPEAAWSIATRLPGVDAILTAGSPAGVSTGLSALVNRPSPDRMLVGGGLQPSHLPVLRAAGVTSVHIGRSARLGGSWTEPVSPTLVAHWKSLITTAY